MWMHLGESDSFPCGELPNLPSKCCGEWRIWQRSSALLRVALKHRVYRPVEPHKRGRWRDGIPAHAPPRIPRTSSRASSSAAFTPPLILRNRNARRGPLVQNPAERIVEQALMNQSSADPPFPSFVFTLAATGTTLSISMFSSAEYSVCRAVWNSFVGLNMAFALRAAPALWRANRAWSSPMISSAAASGIRSPLISTRTTA